MFISHKYGWKYNRKRFNVKKLFISLLTFVVGITSQAIISARAEEDISTASEAFPIKICGTQVTTENMDNILGDGAASYKFDGDHTLTISTYPGSGLTEAMYTGNEPRIYSELEGLIIKTVNSPIITSSKDAIVLTKNTTLSGCSLDIYADETAICIKKR